MAWEQGPYPATDDCIRPVGIADVADTIRVEKIDCIYSLLQVYSPSSWGPSTPGVEHDVWTLLRTLLMERERGDIDVPMIRHWGSDVTHVDLDVVRALDAHLLSNPEKLDQLVSPEEGFMSGRDVFTDCDVIEFLDSDRPKLEFMNERFTEKLSDRTQEIHTVCIGRPLGIDFETLALNGIHVHVYGNAHDDAAHQVAHNLSTRSRLPTKLLERYVHLHPPLQAIGGDWPGVQRVKERWVPEFSRYDAGWSYIGDTPDAPLHARAQIPNRVGTYLLAGLPVITDVQPGYFRYEELRRLGVNIDLHDYGSLRDSLETEIRTREQGRRALEEREAYSFDATIDPLMNAFGRSSETYFSKPAGERTRFAPGPEPRLAKVGGIPGAPRTKGVRAMLHGKILARRSRKIGRLLTRIS